MTVYEAIETAAKELGFHPQSLENLRLASAVAADKAHRKIRSGMEREAVEHYKKLLIKITSTLAAGVKPSQQLKQRYEAAISRN